MILLNCCTWKCTRYLLFVFVLRRDSSDCFGEPESPERYVHLSTTLLLYERL